MQIVSTAPTATADEVQTSRLFQNWAARVQDTWDVTRVTVLDAFGPKGTIRMLFMRVTQAGSDYAVMLRGSSVDVLTVLSCEGSTYLVHVDQPRLPVGQIVRSNPAGMVDDDAHVSITALRELEEEIGMSLDWGPPLNLNEVVYGVDLPELGTPGGSDEDVTFFAVHVQVTAEDLVKLRGRVAGLQSEGERTVVHLTKFSGKAASILPLLTVAGQRPDMKAAHSLLMYDCAMEVLHKG